jgi:hypothetical protein
VGGCADLCAGVFLFVCIMRACSDPARQYFSSFTIVFLPLQAPISQLQQRSGTRALSSSATTWILFLSFFAATMLSTGVGLIRACVCRVRMWSVCTCKHAHIKACTHVCMCVRAHARTRICFYTHMCACVCLCTHETLCARACINMCLCTHVRVSIHALLHTCASVRMALSARMCKCMYVPLHELCTHVSLHA